MTYTRYSVWALLALLAGLGLAPANAQARDRDMEPVARSKPVIDQAHRQHAQRKAPHKLRDTQHKHAAGAHGQLGR